MDIHDVQRLERVAEELMGRRKWKLYQEVLARSQLNANTNTAQNETADQNNRLGLSQQSDKEKLILQPPALVENHSKESEVVTIKSEINENPDDKGCPTADTGNTGERLSESTVDNLESSITKTEEPREPPPPSYPVDWKPTDRCYFCVDGKLLTVNEKGDLVAESGPASSEAELARASLDSDSDSSDSSPEIEVQNQNATNANKTVTSLLRDSLPPNMTSFESMAAHLAAVASLRGLQSGLAPFYPSLWYHQLAQVPSAANTTTSEASVAAISPTIKESTSPSDVTGEQPLDLSAKPSPNSSMTGSMDPKQVFRAKPRVSAVPGRRTYTEEELHSALQDIISGKLGTRRAAVLYGIPRSTLRNKVYKIAMEHRREASALHQGELVDPEDEDRDVSGDDEKDDSLLSSSLGGAQADDLSSFATSHLAAAALQKISKASAEGGNQLDIKPSITNETQPKLSATTPQPQTPPITPNPWFDPNVLLQSLLLTGSLGGIPGLVAGGSAKQDDPAAIQEAFKSFMLHQELIKEQLKGSAVASDLLNNGKPNITDPRILMQNLPLLQQQQQQQHHHQQQQSQVHQQSLHHHYQNRVRNSETPETASSTDMNEASDDPSIILKIPSYKPVAGSSTSSAGKNGEGLSSPIPQTTPPIISRSPHQQNNLQGISPPLLRQSSESQSPPLATNKGLLSLRDVIANSISRTFNQQANKDSCNQKPPPALEPIDPYKRANISVIKNLGGTDISRFAATPNLLGHNSSNSQNSSVAGGLGGKGTRPKRGKYRNYDRDSLVEAVKAVQRGEMSVHRAGSYYGVPHSTLEYKVKERHLMRPRKREPKPQPLDDRTAGGSSNSMNSKNTNIPGLTSVGGLDKSKVGLGQKPPGKNQPFSSTSPNGMKVPIFDPAMAAQLQYSPHLFWPHSSGFSGLPIDFGRPPPGAPGTAPSFPPNAAESLLASQMMQRFHEGTANMRHSASSSGTNSSNSGGAGLLNAANSVTAGNLQNSKPTANNSSGGATKTARELAESLYDGASANGSFLDGIIRQTLDRKTGEISHGALLDQLVKNTRGPATMVCNDDQGRPTNSKRPGSPLHFSPMEIKKERASPISSGVAPAHGDLVDASSIERDISKESVESLLKLRDGLTLKVEDKQQSQQQQQQVDSQHHHHSHHALHQQPQVTSNLRHLSIEDLNGRGSVGIHDSLGQIKSETEDSL